MCTAIKNPDNLEIKISCKGFSLWGSIWQRSEGQKDQNQLTQQTVAAKASVQCWVIHHLPSTEVFFETYSYKKKAENDTGEKDLRKKNPFLDGGSLFFRGKALRQLHKESAFGLCRGHCNNKGTKWYRNNIIYYNTIQLSNCRFNGLNLLLRLIQWVVWSGLTNMVLVARPMSKCIKSFHKDNC